MASSVSSPIRTTPSSHTQTAPPSDTRFLTREHHIPLLKLNPTRRQGKRLRFFRISIFRKLQTVTSDDPSATSHAAPMVIKDFYVSPPILKKQSLDNAGGSSYSSHHTYSASGLSKLYIIWYRHTIPLI